MPLKRGKILQEADQDSDKGCAPILHLFCESKEVLELVCDNQGGGPGDITDKNTATDELQEVSDLEEGADNTESANH